MKDKDELYEEAEQLRKRELTDELALLANWLQCSIGGRIAEARASLRGALRHHFRRQAAEDALDRMKHEPYVLTCETVLRRAEIVSREPQMESAWKLLQRHVPDELNGTSDKQLMPLEPDKGTLRYLGERVDAIIIGSMIYQCGKCGYTTAYQSEHECVPLLGTITTGSETVKAK